ncbi:MAG: IPT/TIG domain-containing protein, partial [Myxococcaceae bacterium]|nr:IPT/TIG domain-containing protein [Myxococcaceae bacterium]
MCGLFLPAGTPAAPCQCFGGSTGCCRTSFGCSCEANCSVYRDCCPQFEPVCNGPLLTDLSPTSVPTAGGTSLTLTGVRLGMTTGSVTVGGVACSISLWSNTSIICTAPPGLGTNQPVIATTSGGLVSNTLLLARLPPAVTSFFPAAISTSSQSLTLVGTNFGTAATVSTDGGVAVPVTSVTQTQVVVTAPEGNDALAVRVSAGGQQSPVATIPRAPPTITSITPSSVPAGGAAITLMGSNFGTSGAASVTVGGAACPVTQSTPHTVLVCTAPAGTGNAAVRVSVGGRTSAAGPSVQYPGPRVSSVAPSTIPTTGARLVFTGTGLDTPNLALIIGGSPCLIAGTPTATSLQCDAPAGAGANLPVSLTVGGIASGTQLLVSYTAPSITGISPTTGPTAGGIALTVSGSNFGVSGQTVTVGGSPCTVGPGGSTSQTQIVCTLPPGAGRNVDTQLVVAGQAATSTAFSYGAPAITGLSPTSPPTAAGPITLSGTNFGAAAASVTVDGTACPVVMATHTSLVCGSPPGQGGTATVRLTAAGQSATTVLTWGAPTLMQVAPPSAPTRGGVVLTLTGANFGTGPRTTVTVGGNPCPVRSSGHTTLTCALPEGTSSGPAPVTVTVAGLASTSNAFTYAAPSVTNVTPTRAPTVGGVVLTIVGSSFGTAPATVTIGGQSCPVEQQSHTSVLCRAPAGQGTGLPLIVTAGAQASASFPFSYEAPLIEGTWPPKLPTAPSTLWIRGRNFGTSPLVTLGGVVCPVVRSTDREVVCTAPAGTPGTPMLLVTTAAQASNAVNVTRIATCGRELANGASCEDPRECRGTGTCSGADCVGAPAAGEGLACDDGDPCSTPGMCRSGVCSAPVGLDGGEACATASTCTGLGACLAGRCNAVPANEDAGCTDFDGATSGDVCQMGVCIGTPAADAGVPDGGAGGGAAGGTAGGAAGGMAGGAAGGTAGGAAGGMAGGAAGGTAGGAAGGTAGGAAGGTAGGAAGGMAGGAAGGTAGG